MIFVFSLYSHLSWSHLLYGIALKVIVCIILINLSLGAYAEDGYEELLEVEEETSEQSEILDQLEELEGSPIDLNTASALELGRIPWLTPSQALAIVRYRKEKGRFQSVEELKGLEGIDAELFDKIAPLVRVGPRLRVPAVSGRWRTRVTDRKPDTIGHLEGEYGPSSQKVYSRLDLAIKRKAKIGAVVEKDAGERRFDDFSVYSMTLEDVWLMDRLVIGNYGLEFGQGLVLWSRWRLPKGSEVIGPLKKRERGVRAYTSTDEVAPFTGFSAKLSLGPTGVSLFLSQAWLDASLNTDGTVSSLYQSGLHRTGGELLKKDVLEEKLYGGRISYFLGGGSRVGITFYRSRFDRRFDNKDYERNRFLFRGSDNSVYGMDYDLYLSNLNLFGEMAKSAGSGQGVVMGVIANFGKLDVATLIRSYDRDFYSPYGFGFADLGGQCKNEIGAFVGAIYRLNRRTKLKAYFDQFRHPWRRYAQPMPTDGDDCFGQIEHHPLKGLDITVRGRVKKKEVYSGKEGKSIPRVQRNLRTQIDWQPYPGLRLSGRLEKVWVRYGLLSKGEDGELVFTGVRIRPATGLTIYGRLIFFDTQSYDSRLYEYENDLPGVMRNVALFGRGRRWFLLMSDGIADCFRIWIKYSHTGYDGVRSMGSGREQRVGDEDHRFGIQVDLNF